jgi:hypothetical protein
MGKGNTATKHHCVGHKAWIGDISLGGCREVKVGGMVYCDKHEMPCRNGCKDWQHLKNQSGCMACKSRSMADSRRERATANKNKDAAKREEDESFWKPAKDKKKHRD